jgi:hypothetical protein
MDKEQARIEYLKEKAKLYTELLKVATAFIIATTGGLVSLFFKLSNKISLPLVAIGIWVLAISLMVFAKAWINAKDYLEEIRKWTEKS